MSDYVYSSVKLAPGAASESLRGLYSCNKQICELSGDWGSLAVFENHYPGFSLMENEQYIAVVIGGPVLKYESISSYLRKSSGNFLTNSMFKRWLSGALFPDKDISGPFSFLVIDKRAKRSHVYTDLMAFIPIWFFSQNGQMVCSSHPEAVNHVLNRDLDGESILEFINTGVVTHPYSVYKEVVRLDPASLMTHDVEKNKRNISTYYEFKSQQMQGSTKEKARKIREALKRYVDYPMALTDNPILFGSGGEDSRVVLALLSQKNTTLVTILDRFNREGKIAKMIARVHHSDFICIERGKKHYMRIVKGAGQIVGSGGQYLHAHMYGHKELELMSHGVFFGGFAADRYLKGEHVGKVFSGFPFLPSIRKKHGSILYNNRQKRLLSKIKLFRTDGSEFEWLKMWPSSMAIGSTYFNANRRMFRIYEPFFDNDIVKISASVSVRDKLNRKFFYKMAKPFYKKTWYVPHAGGWYPYFPKIINVPIHAIVWIFFFLKRKIYPEINDGPWCNWKNFSKTKDWRDKLNSIDLELVNKYLGKDGHIQSLDNLDFVKQSNLLQIYELIKNIDEKRNKNY